MHNKSDTVESIIVQLECHIPLQHMPVESIIVQLERHIPLQHMPRVMENKSDTEENIIVQLERHIPLHALSDEKQVRHGGKYNSSVATSPYNTCLE